MSSALKNISTRKSAGPDGLDPSLLKLSAEVIADPLTYIFNLSLEQSCIPDSWKLAHVVPLLKSGDPAILDNYRPISKLSVLAKNFESIVSDQIKEYLTNNCILSPAQSGFRKKHSTITAAVKVVNDIISSMDSRNSCAALFVDLSKAFDTVNHGILLHSLYNIGMSVKTLSWFNDYFINRYQCVSCDGIISERAQIKIGVPQGSILGPLLFTIYINDICASVNANVHLYADDTILYCSAPSPSEALAKLQVAFTKIQENLLKLQLVLNSNKTKYMLFSNSQIQTLPQISTLQGQVIERVSNYKYLGFLLDEDLTFNSHVSNLVQKLKVKLGFYYRNKACFNLKARKELVTSTFVSVLDYGDILYMHASKSMLRSLDSVYHSALRFITGAKYSTHHCDLYSISGCHPLSVRRQLHWLTFIYKAVIGLLPSYLLLLFSWSSNKRYNLRSNNIILFNIPSPRTNFGKSAFQYNAPSSWNELQKCLKLVVFIPLSNFKSCIANTLQYQCKCF